MPAVRPHHPMAARSRSKELPHRPAFGQQSYGQPGAAGLLQVCRRERHGLIEPVAALRRTALTDAAWHALIAGHHRPPADRCKDGPAEWIGAPSPADRMTARAHARHARRVDRQRYSSFRRAPAAIFSAAAAIGLFHCGMNRRSQEPTSLPEFICRRSLGSGRSPASGFASLLLS